MTSESVVEVSIITPVYNGERFIPSAAESVFNQTFTNFEWVVINDCSSDSSVFLLEELARRDNRVTVINHEVNQGPVVARNTGFDRAKGRFIAFLDVDDCWHPEKLEKQISLMKEKGLALSYTGYSRISNDGCNISKKVIHVPKRVSRKSILKTCSIMASSAVFDREVTGNIKQDTDSPHKDDLHLWVRILGMTDYAYGIRENLSYLRIHTTSFTGNKFAEARNQWLFYRHTLQLGAISSLGYYIHYALRGTIKYIRLRFLSH